MATLAGSFEIWILRRYFTIFLVFFLNLAGWATHNRAGEIVYTHVSGLEYEIIIYTYTKTTVVADRNELPINYGDGSPQDTLFRVQETMVNNTTKRNTYIGRHVFPGPGTYFLCTSDPNRNVDVLNIENSVQTVFALQTELTISPFGGYNNSVVMLNSPIQNGCLYQPWIYNPAAYDPDPDDSLSYELVTSMGEGCNPLINFSSVDLIQESGVPTPAADNNISIDPSTGTIIWETPQRQGQYNIAMRITEWSRENSSNTWRKVGAVVRDMQITILTCNNQPPEIELVKDTCIEAGSTLITEVFVSDPNMDIVTLSAYGGPFVVEDSPATFPAVSIPPQDSGTLTWNTTCSHVRLSPYQVVFIATDYAPDQTLSNVETYNITVVAPAPEGLSVTPQGNSLIIDWFPTICANAEGYRIYRRSGLYGYEPDHCETGVPAYTGYSLVGEVEGIDNTTFIDDQGINFGTPYCYMVIAYFPDGAESYASEEVCGMLRREIPIITHVSIGETSTTEGVDTLRWEHPIEIDTVDAFPPPYYYRILRGEGFSNPDEVIYETSQSNTLSGLEKELTSFSFNTEDQAISYVVELHNENGLVSTSNDASSVFLTIEPGDNSLVLEWNTTAPWDNYKHFLYKLNEQTGEFEFLDSTDNATYTDTGLVNNSTYCYYVITEGSYYTDDLPDPLINFSQIACGIPYDNTPPCPPVLSLESDCVEFLNDLEWTNPNETCPETDDVLSYNVYYSITDSAEFNLIATIEGPNLTGFLHAQENTAAGCYAITALDSLSLWPNGEMVRNESEFSNVICVDNCPEYQLPNVFTPNNDGKNDVFRPLIIRSVESVEMQIFNRWGMLVFETTDPEIMWDGTDMNSGEPVSDGIYYYSCNAITIRLSGPEIFNLAGFVQIYTQTPPRAN